MNKLYEEKGITIIALIVTIILMLILASISIRQGTQLIQKSKVETYETNMLMIEAKAKEYQENIEALNWDKKNNDADANGLTTKEKKNRDEYKDKYYLTLIEDKTQYNNYSLWYQDGYTYYVLSQKALDNMGLNDLWSESEQYVICYALENESKKDPSLDIIYVNGVSYQGKTYYNLSELQEVL